MKKLLGIVVLGFYRRLDTRLDHLEIKQGLDYCEQRKRK